ncbi:MepB family protein [Rufibacter sp. LB8]|uniref:MepB family protein n=1 Tax=Rufibacter sp. LB8 TaxID=2777781 RepID=UPI00178C50F7|nr:MepB family protein [Rufibacter sp. LB8]
MDVFTGELRTIKELVYDKCGLAITHPVKGRESLDYEAWSFRVNGKFSQHRTAKSTPAKTGHFVTIWKRNAAGATAPYHVADDLDFILVTARDGNKLGQFLFPKAVLAQRGILASDRHAGKRGIRVYAPWAEAMSQQAKNTQAWQLPYFLDLTDEQSIDFKRVQRTFA